MNILLFTGAGIGVPLKLPITTQFESVLEQGDPIILGHLQDYLKDRSNDVEHVLYTLEQLNRSDNFTADVIRSRRDFDHNFARVQTYLEDLQNRSAGLIHDIKNSIYEILTRYDGLDAAAFYTSLLLQLQSLSGGERKVAISIFTTNYDLSFEDADELTASFSKLGIKDINYGLVFRSGGNRFDKTVDYKWDSKVIEYKKLHGSLDWTLNRNICVRSGTSITPAKPEEMPLLYPGYKETPTLEPFKTIHDQLLQRLLTADGVIIAGFAFRDPYINNLFDTALRINKEASFYCFNPAPLESLPKESAIPGFKNNYGHFHYVQEGAALADEVLNLKTVSLKAVKNQ